MADLPEVPADLPGVRSCGEIVSYGYGDRYSHTYCDRLPAGHPGPHLGRPTPETLSDAWAHVLLPHLYAATLRHAARNAYRCPTSDGFVTANEIHAWLTNMADEAIPVEPMRGNWVQVTERGSRQWIPEAPISPGVGTDPVTRAEEEA